jgi:prepilin-type N-terminal cleavage/methylation domain-containing protein
MPTSTAGSDFFFSEKSRGFTLLEMLLVLAVVSLGLGLAITSTDRLAQRMGEKYWADKTLQTLKKMRHTSIIKGDPVTLFVNFEQGTISDKNTVIIEIPSGFDLLPTTNISNDTGNTVLTLKFWPDGTLNSAHFILKTPSGDRQNFRLEKISGRIERFQSATP